MSPSALSVAVTPSMGSNEAPAPIDVDAGTVSTGASRSVPAAVARKRLPNWLTRPRTSPEASRLVAVQAYSSPSVRPDHSTLAGQPERTVLSPITVSVGVTTDSPSVARVVVRVGRSIGTVKLSSAPLYR